MLSVGKGELYFAVEEALLIYYTGIPEGSKEFLNFYPTKETTLEIGVKTEVSRSIRIFFTILH